MFLIILVISSFLKEAQFICEPTVVDNLIFNMWKGIPPTDIISRLNGTWTFYKVGFLSDEIECWQQVIDSDKALSTELFYRKNHKNPLKLETTLYEGPGFMTKLATIGGHPFSDYLYLLYLNHGVAALYFCGFGPDPFVIISIRDFDLNKDKPETKEALRQVEDVVRELGLQIPSKVSTNCPKGRSKVAVPPVQFSIPLDTSGLHTLYWTVDYDSQRVSVELHSNVSLDSWFALGFSDTGDVKNGDFCMIWTDTQNISRIQDIWTDEGATIHGDDQQDCFYQGLKRNNDVTVAVFSRKFRTCDHHDYIIEDGTLRIVWATGPGPIRSAEGLVVTTAQHGFVSTRLLRPVDADPVLSDDVWTFKVAQDNFKVPKTDIYWCKMVKLSEKFKEKHHIVKFESVVTPGNEHLVHHMILKQCEAPVSPAEFPCHSTTKYSDLCSRVLAMGLGDFSFPEEAGFVLGGVDSPIYVILEIHYTPPDITKDWVDSSGLLVHVTPRLRRYDADVLELGLEYNGETALPPGQPRFPVTSRCVASCTSFVLPADGITVFGSRLHSHSTAIGMVTRHFREGVELPEVVRDNHYDVHEQPMWRLRRSVKVLPGDELVTTCWFNTMKRSNVTLTGVGTLNEMCLDIVYYYPKVALSVCKSSVNEENLNEYFRTTNGEVVLEGDLISRHNKNFRKIEWTPERVESLLDLYNRSRIDVQCILKTNGLVQVPGNWKNLTVEAVSQPLPLEPQQCIRI